MVNVGDGDYQKLNIQKPQDETQAFVMDFKANADGELHFAANDLSSRIGFIDKYDNNIGWVWVKVRRK